MLKLILDLCERQLCDLEAQPRKQRKFGNLTPTERQSAAYIDETNITSLECFGIGLEEVLEGQGHFLKKGNTTKDMVYVSPFSFA